MEATLSSETSIYNKPTRRHIPEHGILKKRTESVCMLLVGLVFNTED
jgi:hypothetical protein